MSDSPFIGMPELLRRYTGVWSRYQLYEHIRCGRLPHRKLPGRRELIFNVADLEAYEAGNVDLETIKLPDGGRICRPRTR
jgi:hypothetical protein